MAMTLKDIKQCWNNRPLWLIDLNDKTSFKKVNKAAWCAYMRMISAARDLDKALEAPKKGCQCNAHGG